MADQDLAQLIAAAVMALLTIILLTVSRRVSVVVADSVMFTPPGGPQRTLLKGDRVPPNEVAAALQALPGSVAQVRASAFSAIVVGKDHRTSTSKTVVFVWTLAIAFGLISLLVAKWLGDHTGWDHQVHEGLQEEYLLLLGGPYAAAVLAKYRAVGQTAGEGKPPAPVGTQNAAQLVTDDEGDTDLGDFQYVLFNLIALAFVLGDFIGDLHNGFPDLPPILTGLVLTSAAGYSAKKLVHQTKPTLTSVVPAMAARGAVGIQIYGVNLLIPASVSPTGAAIAPMVTVGGKSATVTASDEILGADRLTVTIDANATAGSGTISVVRADGIPAIGPAGADGIAFSIT